MGFDDIVFRVGQGPMRKQELDFEVGNEGFEGTGDKQFVQDKRRDSVESDKEEASVSDHKHKDLRMMVNVYYYKYIGSKAWLKYGP